jgi:hypothetical protein
MPSFLESTVLSKDFNNARPVAGDDYVAVIVR